LDNLDTAAVAALIGVDPRTITTYRIRHAHSGNPCPTPAGRVGGHPYWTDRQAWLDWNGRRTGRTGRPRGTGRGAS
jgi:hypothetical protein